MRVIQTLLLILALSAMSSAINTAVASQIARPGVGLGFVPHKALYEIELENARSGSQIVNVEGHMYYEWSYDCEAWNSKHRFNVLYEYADSPAIRLTSDFSNFEAYDASTLDYSAIRRQNGVEYEKIIGHAKTDAGQTGRADFNNPEGLHYDLPVGTLYPMKHTLNVVEAIQDNQKFYNAVVFDGSDDEGPVEINAFIGNAIDVPYPENKSALALDKELLSAKANKVQLAFFPYQDKQEKADYEMDLILHHNSIISTMNVHYDDFTVRQKLIALEPIDQEKSKNACQ